MNSSVSEIEAAHECSHHECLHCGEKLEDKKTEAEAFCCSGCAYVYKFVQQEDLTRFYDLNTISKPVYSDGNLSPEIEQWIQEKESLPPSSYSQELSLQISGISCAACVWLIEKIFKKNDGAINIHISPQQSMMRMELLLDTFKLREFIWQVTKLGYKFSPLSANRKKISESRRLLPKIGMAAMFMLHTMLFTFPHYLGLEIGTELGKLFHTLAFIFTTFSFILGVNTFFTRAYQALKRRVIHMDFPISLGILTAYIGCLVGFFGSISELMYFDFISTFIFLMLVGRYFQEFAVERNQNQIIDYDLSSQLIERNTPTGSEQIPLSAIAASNHYHLTCHNWIPVRSRLLSESAELSLESLNGEPEAKTVTKGAIIPSGAKSLGKESIECVALESWKESRLAELASLEDEQDTLLHKTQSSLKWYMSAVLVTAVAGLIFWLTQPNGLVTAFQVFVSTLVISCPCALGISIPMIHQIAVSRLKKSGIFVKKSSIWQKINQVRAVMFDKTGTLTLEYPILINTIELQALPEHQLQVLYSMTEQSLHPVCLSVQESILPFIKNITPLNLTISEQIGHGIRTTWDGHSYELRKAKKPTENGLVSTFVIDGKEVLDLRFEECLRQGSQKALHFFKDRNFELFILSGDQQKNVEKTANYLGFPIHRAKGALSPSDKAAFLQSMSSKNPLMLGDGLNDRLAFANAYCKGTPFRGQSILEQSVDFYYTSRDMYSIIELFDVAQKYRKTLHSVFAFAVSYNVIAVAFCLAGIVNPLIAAILMPLSALTSLTISKLGMIKGK